MMQTTTSLSPEEIRLAKENLEIFARQLGKKVITGRIGEKGKECVFRLPETTVRLVVDLLSETSRGNPVAIMPLKTEFSTQQAANFLNVSRPFFVNLLEKGEIPFRKVGSHRRVRFDDLIRYKKKTDKRSLEALDELVTQAQDLGMGY
ncbi:MAG: excisionase family DNA-binding protein [Candidatus Omnitrophica bacterium]|nr:excisionase family DNA-binding protein [Candidatus Omnitrophota bacterium]MCB9781439.1 excisionase family DNA-binding protein [Candidatus Omnitrophota bacterium]